MKATYTVTKPVTLTQLYAEQRQIRVTLPAAPFDIPATDRSETAPRGLPVRNSDDWRKVDRVLRHAERIAR